MIRIGEMVSGIGGMVNSAEKAEPQSAAQNPVQNQPPPDSPANPLAAPAQVPDKDAKGQDGAEQEEQKRLDHSGGHARGRDAVRSPGDIDGGNPAPAGLPRAGAAIHTRIAAPLIEIEPEPAKNSAAARAYGTVQNRIR